MAKQKRVSDVSWNWKPLSEKSFWCLPHTLNYWHDELNNANRFSPFVDEFLDTCPSFPLRCITKKKGFQFNHLNAFILATSICCFIFKQTSNDESRIIRQKIPKMARNSTKLQFFNGRIHDGIVQWDKINVQRLSRKVLNFPVTFRSHTYFHGYPINFEKFAIHYRKWP